MESINLGAVMISAFVSIVAIVGWIYFKIQDKKEAKKQTNK